MEEKQIGRINPLTILNFATFLQYQRFVMPISFLFYLQNGLTFSDFILCQSLYSATCLIGKFVTGFIGDIFSKKNILIVAYFLFMLRVILWINFSGFWIVLSGEILYGLFKALYRGNVDSYIYEYLKQNNINQEMISKYGKLSFYTSLGSAISCFAGVILYKFYGFKTILYIELITQIIAIASMFLLPKLHSENKFNNKLTYYIKSTFNTIKDVITNKKINYFIYYSAMLTGLTGIFVWNFQPLLKISSAPIFLYAIVHFINQILRAIGGIQAKNIVNRLKTTQLIYIEYIAVICAFILLLSSYLFKNYIFIFISLIIICFAILLFVVFGIFNISQIHLNIPDKNRATSASVNSFIEDFTSFFLLLCFKLTYDNFGITYSITIFAMLTLFLLYPKIFSKNFSH